MRNDTVLHVISNSHVHGVANDKKAIVELLTKTGAHYMECVHTNGQTPLASARQKELCKRLRSTRVLPWLKCLCARRITGEAASVIIYSHQQEP